MLQKDGATIPVKCEDIWGFSYEGAIFRIDPKYKQPALIWSMGKLIYYENGLAHLTLMRDEAKEAEVGLGYFCYVSKDLTSELVPMPGQKLSDAHKKIVKFKEENPQYRKLFDCIGDDYHYAYVRSCILAYEMDK